MEFDLRRSRIIPIMSLILHRSYIDDIELPMLFSGETRRVPEVFDCWFESGSMPYGQSHYPFENKKSLIKLFRRVYRRRH